MSTKPVFPPETAPSDLPVFDLEGAWDLHPRVEIRPERFGALLYSFDTRRLSFLRSPELLAVVQALAAAPTARAACTAAGIGEAELATYRAALARLAETDMITPREEGHTSQSQAARTAPGRPLAALSSSPIQTRDRTPPPPCQETPGSPPASTWD